MFRQTPEYIKNPQWRLSRDDFTPAYLKLYESDRSVFDERIEEGLQQLRNCRVCPRNCEVDRMNDEHGKCRTGRRPYVGSYFPHFGEEDCLRGWNGSGTIFFSFCNLKCVFCQNHELSLPGFLTKKFGFQQGEGKIVAETYLQYVEHAIFPLTRLRDKFRSVFCTLL